MYQTIPDLDGSTSAPAEEVSPTRGYPFSVALG